MSESDGLWSGKVAVARVFRDASKLRQFLEQTKPFRIDLERCDFRQVESFIRELAPPHGAIPPRGAHVLIGYQDLVDDELGILQQYFRQELKEARKAHPDLFH